jgi:hypothetical protein
MRKSIVSKAKIITLLFILAATFSCTKEALNDNTEPIAGKWFLTSVNGTDVSEVACYQDSFIDSDGTEISFFLQDREANGDCTILLNNTQLLTIQEGFYYIGDEALDFTINGNSLTWVVDAEATLTFRK